MRNEPSYFWLWDSEQRMFVENEQLNEISDFSEVSINEDGRISSYSRASFDAYGVNYYEYRDGEFVWVEQFSIFCTEEDDEYYQITQISKLIDGEMQIVEETKELVNDLISY